MMVEKNIEVDKLTSYEFIKEVYKEIPQAWLYKIEGPMRIKSKLFKAYLSKDKILTISAEEMKIIVKKVFSVRKASKKWKKEDYLALRPEIHKLIHSEEELNLRFNNFCNFLVKLKVDKPFDLGSELLFHYSPKKYWLWTKWMYDPSKNTGALTLVLNGGSLSHQTTYGNHYLEIGRAIKEVDATASEIGIRAPNESTTSPYEISIFLSAIYAVYAYTMARVSYTKEFTRILPKMAELILRILGVFDGDLMNDEVN